MLRSRQLRTTGRTGSNAKPIPSDPATSARLGKFNNKVGIVRPGLDVLDERGEVPLGQLCQSAMILPAGDTQLRSSSRATNLFRVLLYFKRLAREEHDLVACKA